MRKGRGGGGETIVARQTEKSGDANLFSAWPFAVAIAKMQSPTFDDDARAIYYARHDQVVAR